MAKKEKKEEKIIKVEKPEKEKKGSVVTVYDKNRVILRVMSKKGYGVDFREKAKMLAGKQEGRVIIEGGKLEEEEEEEIEE